YLAPELAALGYEVTLINNVAKPGTYAGVRCPGPAATLTAHYLNQFDAVIVINTAMGAKLRQAGVSARLILWSQQASDQKDVQELRQRGGGRGGDAFFLVTPWQARSYASDFAVPPERIPVLRNAAAPVFQPLERRPPPFFRSGRPPTLVYT